MSRAEIGLGLRPEISPRGYGELAQQAESLGFDVISVFGDLYYQPPIVALLEMARATSRLRLGAACWNPYTMHPYEIAGQLAALDDVSDGRSYLGLARGSWLSDIGVAQPQPVRYLRQSVAVIRALLAGDTQGVTADVFPLAAGARLQYPLPVSMPSLLVGTWGPRIAALAGELADELKIGGSANPAMVAVMRERIAVGLGVSGRRPEDVGIVLGAVTVVDDDGLRARTRARSQVAMYVAVVGDLDPTVELAPDLVSRIQQLVASGDQDSAGALIPDDVLDLFAFSGTPIQVAAQAQRVLDAGARRVEFGAPFGLTTAVGIDLLGRRVLPLLNLG
jgi:5,10-methylenetetrahydromethanopterin reductase